MIFFLGKRYYGLLHMPPNPSRLSRSLADLSLRTKLVVSFLTVAALSIGSVSLFAYYMLRANLIERAVTGLRTDAALLARGIGELLDMQVHQLRSYALNKPILSAVHAANAAYPMDPSAAQARLLQKDRLWKTAKSGDRLIQSRLDNSAAADLRDYQDAFDGYGELFVTDKFGGLVAASRRTSDYYQADEDWWQAAWNGGKGAVYIGNPAYDESSRTFSLIIALPLRARASKEVIGILRAAYRVQPLMNLVLGFSPGKNGGAMLLLPSGHFVSSQVDRVIPLPPFIWAQMQASSGSAYSEMPLNGAPSLLCQVPVRSTKDDPFIAILGWRIAAHMSRKEALEPMADIALAGLAVSAACLILIGFLAAKLADLHVKPLKQIQGTARRIAEGHFDHRLALTQRDEVGALASSFDAMADALEKYVLRLRSQQEAVAASENRFRSLVDQSLAGIYIIQDGKFVYVNPKLAEIFGYTQEEIAPEQYSEAVPPPRADGKRPPSKTPMDLVAPRDRPLVAENIRKRIEGESSGIRYSFQGLRKDGKIIEVEVYGSRTTMGGRPAVIGMLLDNTESKSLQKQLLQAQKMEAVGRLAGGVAHDFNNILTTILAYSSFLQDNLPADDPKRADVHEIQISAQRAASLTRQLLIFSRQQVLQPQPINLNLIVSGMEKMLRRLIGEDVALTASLHPALGRIEADPGQMEQILMNLSVNARDAMPKGGGLTIETANVNLDEAYASQHAEVRPGPYVLLSVSDTGCGMSQEIQSRIFEPFFTTKGPGKGTGLGLSIVYGIVKAGGGHLSVYSEPGHGSTFKIYLPRIQTPAQETVQEQETAASTTGNETILLVEDDEQIRRITRRTLADQGYAVLEASHGLEGLEIGQRHNGPIHLLLTDIVMPRMGGDELAGKLTALRPKTRVLFFSGYSESGVIQSIIKKSRIHFLQKPFTPDALIKKVREVLDQQE